MSRMITVESKEAKQKGAEGPTDEHRAFIKEALDRFHEIEINKADRANRREGKEDDMFYMGDQWPTLIARQLKAAQTSCGYCQPSQGWMPYHHQLHSTRTARD